ncbi:hypothetical protein [Salmonella enterica]|uniref:hypothetical protein n=1 Tax=Salmonella enterica TaxID=28901 RepID=UPI00039AC1B3
MQMMRTADSRWPESLQQQQATAQWNEILKTRAQSSTTATGSGYNSFLTPRRCNCWKQVCR